MEESLGDPAVMADQSHPSPLQGVLGEESTVGQIEFEHREQTSVPAVEGGESALDDDDEEDEGDECFDDDEEEEDLESLALALTMGAGGSGFTSASFLGSTGSTGFFSSFAGVSGFFSTSFFLENSRFIEAKKPVDFFLGLSGLSFVCSLSLPLSFPFPFPFPFFPSSLVSRGCSLSFAGLGEEVLGAGGSVCETGGTNSFLTNGGV